MNQLALTIEDPSQVAEARRRTMALMAHDFDDNRAGAVALAVTELATNLLKHAGRGTLLVRRIEGASVGVELVSLDRGPGIRDVALAMRDGRSTAGSPGFGLGTLSRIASDLDIYSTAERGTVIYCLVWNTVPRHAEGIAAGVVCLPRQGEVANGDDCRILPARSGCVVLVVDGLGHGPEAASAARAATGALDGPPDGNAAELLERVHDALKPTRGAAAAVALLRPEAEVLSYCGVGNIVGLTRVNGKTRNLVSHNGILGHQVRKFQQFDTPFPKGSLFYMHSDGIATHWKMEDYPGLETRRPALMAAVLYRDYDRGRDDRTVVVLRNGGRA